MKILFYAHREDLDHIWDFLHGTHKEEYTIEVYQHLSGKATHDSVFAEKLIQISVSYPDYLRLQPILEFV